MLFWRAISCGARILAEAFSLIIHRGRRGRAATGLLRGPLRFRPLTRAGFAALHIPRPYALRALEPKVWQRLPRRPTSLTMVTEALPLRGFKAFKHARIRERHPP